MLSDLLGDMISTLFGGFLGDELHERRNSRTSGQIAAFNGGQEIRIPCALRENDEAWRHGFLRLKRGHAAWLRRFAKEPSLILDRRTLTPQQGRRVRGRESLGLNPKLIVLGYQMTGTPIELAVRRSDLSLVARVLELPPISL